MTIAQIRRRIDALKRKFAPEIAIIELRRIAESVADDWDPADPPEPGRVIRRIADAGFRLSTFGGLHHCLKDARGRGNVPNPVSMVLSLLPWAQYDRYFDLLHGDLPAPAAHGRHPARSW